jgi:hypothetical protein
MLVLIYILNYVGLVLFDRLCYSESQCTTLNRSTGPTCRGPLCHFSFGCLADMLLQCCSSRRIRGRLAPERAAIQHSSRHILRWLCLDASTVVRPLISRPISFLSIFQKYVLESHRKAFYISPCLHGIMGHTILLDRSVSCLPSRLIFSTVFSQVLLTTLRVPSLRDSSLVSLKLQSSLALFSFYQSGTSVRNLVFARHCSPVVFSLAMLLARL